MAKIRLGQFGNQPVPPVTGGRTPTQAFVVDRSGLAAGAQQGAAILLDAERTEERKRTEELRRAQKVAAYAGYQADVDDITEGLTTDLTEKKVKRDDLEGELTKRLEEAKKKRLEGLDSESQATVSAHFTTAERRGRSIIRRARQADEKQERTAQLTTALEEFDRVGVRDPAGAIKQVNMLLDLDGPGLLGADRVAAHKQSFAERAWANHFTDRIVRSRNDAVALGKLEAEISGNETLDPEKKSILLGRAAGHKETVLAKAARAEASRLKVIEHQIGQTEQLIMSSYQPSSEQLLALSAAAKGTIYEPVVKGLVAFSNQTAKFSASSPRAQEAALTALEAQVRRQPTPDGAKTLDAYRRIAANQQQLVRDDPISFAAQRGLATIEPIDFTKLGQIDDQLKARVAVSRGLQAQYGAPLKVLTKQEAAMLSDFMRRGTAEERTQLLQGLKKAMPDDESYAATMQQIAPDSPSTAWAGSLMSRRPFVQENLVRPDVETQATRVAQLIVKGEGVLNPSPLQKKEDGRGAAFKMPQERDLLAGFESAMGLAYRGREDAHRIAYQSARAVYAALAVEDGDYSGEFRSGRWEQAVNLATGGATTFNGAKVVRPYGMREDEFKNAVFGELGKLSASGRVGFSKEQMSRMQLESVGDSQYLVRSGTGYLLDKQGSPVVIDLMNKSVIPPGFTDEQGRPIVSQIPQ